jgi:hypothetical protein
MLGQRTEQRPAQHADRNSDQGRERHRQTSGLPRRAHLMRSVGVGDLRLGPHPEEVEHPERAREQDGAHAQGRQRTRAQPRDEGGVDEPRDGLGDERDQHGHRQRDERVMGSRDEGMSVGRRLRGGQDAPHGAVSADRSAFWGADLLRTSPASSLRRALIPADAVS